jgi:nicotinamide riboside transporter PnuC
MSGNDTDNLQPWSIAVTTSVTALALVCVCLRMLSRYERKQALWWDDYMIIFSMVCALWDTGLLPRPLM